MHIINHSQHLQSAQWHDIRRQVRDVNTFRVANRVAMMPHTMTRKDSHRRAPTRCRARLLGTCRSHSRQV